MTTLFGGKDPTAFSVLTQALSGQVGFTDAEFCTTCGDKGADKRCSICKKVVYCGLACQKLHWFTHRRVCRPLQEQSDQRESATLRQSEQRASIVEDGRELPEAVGSLLNICSGFGPLSPPLVDPSDPPTFPHTARNSQDQD
ncbi:hypothetical protein AGOR_G00044640 [Albula goreensis]|uniref:MYND-type domain-containing protein n=1 Tax=Albula goreensis TaxID=1534307 RepID=A0A8T3E2E9_9TELE|nr:hypothetical protein AGOR_G00044640 [Albula goreensis]